LDSEIETKKNRVSYVVFAIAITVVGINFISVFFPALLVPLTTGSEIPINYFEPGAWAFPALVVNVTILYIVTLHYVKKIPSVIQNAIQFILNFEVSRKISFIVIVIILGGYIAFTIQDLNMDERKQWPDFERLEPVIEGFPESKDAIESIRILYVKNFLLYSSQNVFENVKVVPFMGSIVLLVVTYFFTARIANKRFAGLVAMVILLQSHTFLRYDTVATYANFWTLFYLLSLYVIYNRWYISPASYILSIFSKPLSAIFLPMTLFFVYRADISKRKKIKVSISYGIVVTIMVIGLLSFGIDFAGHPPKEIFNELGFWSGFTTWYVMLRFDIVVLLFLPALTVGLFMISRRGILVADSVLVLIVGVLLSAVLLGAFTGYNLTPYRYMPLIVFFAVGVGMLFSKKIIRQV